MKSIFVSFLGQKQSWSCLSLMVRTVREMVAWKITIESLVNVSVDSVDVSACVYEQ